MGPVSDPTIIYKKTRIFLDPSLCDETFCRTVNESMMNGIPVITTGAGNIKYLVGKAGYVISIRTNSIIDCRSYHVSIVN